MRALLLVLAAVTALLLVTGVFGLSRLPYLGFAVHGDQVAVVDRGSPAEEAGLKVGDEIRKVFIESPGTGPAAVEVPTERLWTLPRGTAVGIIYLRDEAARSAFLKTGEPPGPEAVRRILRLLTAFTFLGVGLFTYLRRPDALGRSFLLLCLSLAMVFRSALPSPRSLVLDLDSFLDDLSVVLLAASLIHFVMLFPTARLAGPRRRIILSLAWGGATFLSAVSFVFTFGPRLPLPARQITGALAAIFVAGCIVGALVFFVLNVRRTRDPAAAMRLRVVQWGTILALLPVAVMLFLRNIVPGGGIPGDQFSVLAVWILPLAYMYAIIRHQIFDIRVIVRRSVIYFLLTTCLALIYFGAVLLLGPRLDPREGHPIVALLSLVVIALVFTSTRTFIQTVVDRIFFRAEMGRRRGLADLCGRLEDLVDSGRLEISIHEELARQLKAQRSALYAVDDGGRRLLLRAGGDGPDGERGAGAGGVPQALPFPPALRDLVTRISGPVMKEDLLEQSPPELRSALEQRLDALGFDLYLPLKARDSLHALVALSLPAAGGGPDSQELKLLEKVAHDASEALTRALSREDQLERERLAGELAVARSIQQHLLPSEAPVSPLVELSGVTLACDAVGGDCHDYVELPDSRVGFAVADVSGKGVPAAILMASLQGSFRAGAAEGQSPAALMKALNRRLLEVAEPEKFVCFFYALFDAGADRVVYCNAGLDPPLLIRARGIEEMEVGGPVLGALPGADYAERETAVAAGDVIVCFSDGLVDAGPSETPPLDRGMIEQIVRDNPRSGAEQLLHRLLSAARLVGRTAAHDDVTLVVARIY